MWCDLAELFVGYDPTPPPSLQSELSMSLQNLLHRAHKILNKLLTGRVSGIKLCSLYPTGLKAHDSQDAEEERQLILAGWSPPRRAVHPVTPELLFVSILQDIETESKEFVHVSVCVCV